VGAGDVPGEILNPDGAPAREVRVRLATRDDAVALARLCTQLGYPTRPEDMPLRLEHLAADPNMHVFVAEGDDGVVGLATLHIRHMINHEAPLGQLTTLVVDERSRGQGVGRVLVNAVEQQARARVCKRLIVTTALRRTDAHAFYEKLGFIHTGRRYGKDFA
jgi:GNAT superfamily N-acetyltransferase